jgi:ribosome-associated protein
MKESNIVKTLRPLVSTLVKALQEKKGEDIRLLQVGPMVGYADYLLIVGGASTTQVQALVGAAEKAVQGKWKPTYINRSTDNSWWILDFVDIVVHVFRQDVRQQYGLESLWCDAPDGWESVGVEPVNPSEGND